MIEDEDRRITIFDFLPECVLLLEDLLEAGVVVLDVPDRLGERNLEIIIVFVLEYAGL